MQLRSLALSHVLLEAKQSFHRDVTAQECGGHSVHARGVHDAAAAAAAADAAAAVVDADADADASAVVEADVAAEAAAAAAAAVAAAAAAAAADAARRAPSFPLQTPAAHCMP